MKISQFAKIIILFLKETANPTHLVTTDVNGLLGKTPFISPLEVSGGMGSIDGGSATTVYLNTQNIDGGSATSINSGKIDGGGA